VIDAAIAWWEHGDLGEDAAHGTIGAREAEKQFDEAINALLAARAKEEK